MGRIYPVPFFGTLASGTGNSDLLNISPADDKPCRLVGWSLGQTSEVADANEEAMRIQIRRMTATVTDGSGGSSVTMTDLKLKRSDPAASFAARVNDATVATTTGTDTILEEHAWNIRNSPWIHWIPEEQRPEVAQGERLIVRMETGLVDDVVAELTFWVEELG